MKKKICVIATSRATYGYKKRIIKLIQEAEDLELQLVVTGMHPLKEYGYSIKEIELDKIPIAAQLDMLVGGDTPAAFTKSLGVEIQGLVQIYTMLRPDLVLVTGDRGEMFTACLTAAYMNIPVAHIQAGDVSGHIDGSARHALTKFAHIHLASCENSAKRVERMGEEPWRIFNVGAPQLDEIVHGDKLRKEELSKMFEVNFDNPVLLVLQHPILVENKLSANQMRETLEAVKDSKLSIILVYPNIDAGNESIINVIEEYQDLPQLKVRRNIDRSIFISLLEHVSMIIGNSSSGILEAPSFKLPAINVGNRQRGRMQAPNVVNCNYDRTEILESINFVLYDQKFNEKMQTCVNPYGDGNSSERIVEILKKIDINESLLDKQITY